MKVYRCPGCGLALFDDAAYCAPCGEQANREWEDRQEKEGK